MWIRIRSEALAFSLIAFALVFSGRAHAADDLEVYREKFRVGFEKYQARDFAGAILAWEAIYRELGAARGYRLAFNLGRAYEAYGDPTSAAERYESYLAEIATRRQAGETLEPIVEKQEAEARARLDDLALSRGRIKVVTKEGPIAVQIDSGEPRLTGFTAYVTPGVHTITFEPGTRDARSVTVTVNEGGVSEVEPPAKPTPIPIPVETPIPIPGSLPPMTTQVTEHPFSPWIVVGGGTATAAALVAFVVFYSQAENVLGGNPNNKSSTASSYYNDRTGAYASLGTSIGLGALTAGLATYYFVGTKEVTVPIAPSVDVNARGASLGFRAAF